MKEMCDDLGEPSKGGFCPTFFPCKIPGGIKEWEDVLEKGDVWERATRFGEASLDKTTRDVCLRGLYGHIFSVLGGFPSNEVELKYLMVQAYNIGFSAGMEDMNEFFNDLVGRAIVVRRESLEDFSPGWGKSTYFH